MATANEITKAILELRKSHTEMLITMLDAQAHTLAVETTINAMGQRLQEILAENLASEKHRLLASREELENDLQTIQKGIEIVGSQIVPPGPVN